MAFVAICTEMILRFYIRLSIRQSEAGHVGLWLDMIILSLGAITKCRPVPKPDPSQ